MGNALCPTPYSCSADLNDSTAESLSIGYCDALFADDSDVVCLLALVAFDDVEFNFLVFHERLESFALDTAVVDEHFRAIFTADESVAFGLIEPLDSTFSHS